MFGNDTMVRGGLMWTDRLKHISAVWGTGFSPQRKYNVLVYFCNTTPFSGPRLRLIRLMLEYGRTVHAYFNGTSQEELDSFKAFIVGHMYEAKSRLFVHPLPALSELPYTHGKFIDVIVNDVKISPFNTPRFCNVAVVRDTASAYIGTYERMFPTWSIVEASHRSSSNDTRDLSPPPPLAIPSTHTFVEHGSDGEPVYYDMVQIAAHLSVSVTLVAKRRSRNQFPPECSTRKRVMVWSGTVLNNWLRANNFVVRMASGTTPPPPRTHAARAASQMTSL